MLGSTLTLSSDPPTDVDTNTLVFALRGETVGRSEYGVAGLTSPAANELIVSHDTGKSGEKRHLVRINQTEVDAFGVAATGSVYLNIIDPNNTAITPAILIAMCNRLIDLLLEGGSNANVTKILNNEV